MRRASMAVGLIGAILALCSGALSAANAQSAVELSDGQIENIVTRSYQYVAMYNVNNKFALKQGGWNTCDADTELKDHTMREIARPNNDTLYIGCMLDLREDAVILMASPRSCDDQRRCHRHNPGKLALAGAFLLSTATVAMSQPELVGMAPDPDAKYSPYIQEDFPNQVLFGDTHLHTGYSADAGLVGATTTPDDAYRFAKGETVMSSHGIPARLQRPLDFLVVADHAENLGLTFGLAEGNEALLSTEWGKGLADVIAPKTPEAMGKAYIYWGNTFAMAEHPEDPLAETDLNKTMWQRMTEAAERHNDPGSFTALIGYEWTSGPQGNNLHRNIIFRDGKDKADQVIPFSSYDSLDPEDLWDWMEAYQSNTGGRLLAIPHNGNLSNGLMFDDVTLTSKAPLDRDYAERRMRFEPVYEVTQIKGDGEAHQPCPRMTSSPITAPGTRAALDQS